VSKKIDYSVRNDEVTARPLHEIWVKDDRRDGSSGVSSGVNLEGDRGDTSPHPKKMSDWGTVMHHVPQYGGDFVA